MKKSTLLIIGSLIVATRFASAQTTLFSGDVAFVNAIMHNSSADTFAIVLLKDIDATTQIGFTDGCYKDANGYNLLSSNKNEWYFVWQAPAGGLKRGETIKYWNSLATALNAGGVANCDKGTVVAGDALSLNHNGGTDQIFAFQGIANLDLVNYRLTVDRYLAGIHLNYISGATSDVNWDGSASAAGLIQSELPDSLVNGVSAIRLDSSSVRRTNGYMYRRDLSLDKTVLNNKSNWQSTNKLLARGAIIPRSVWTGSWQGGTPTSTKNVIIQSSVTSPGTFTAQDVRIDPGYAFTINAGNVANIYGDLYNYGSVNSNGDIEFYNVSDTADIYGDTVKFIGIIRVSSSTVLRTNNLLYLNATGAFAYGQIGTGGPYNGTIVGNLTASYYISGGGNGYRHLGAPVNGATLAEINDDVPLNFGTPSSIFQNVYQFNESGVSPHWQPATGLSQSMDNAGFAVFIKADQLPLKIDITGQYFGTDNYVVTGLTRTGATADTSGWHFIRNPWPSGIYWDGSIANVQGTATYIWDQSTGVYSIFDNIFDGMIPPFVSLLVKVTSNNVSVTIPNSSRNVAVATNYFDKTFSAQNYIGISFTNLLTQVSDKVYFTTSNEALNEFDESDGFKLLNREDAPSLYFVENGNKLYKSVYQNLPIDGVHIPLYLATKSYGQYQISSEIQNLEAGSSVFLEDFKLHKLYDLNTSHNIIVSEGDQADRFMMHIFKQEEGITNQQNYMVSANQSTLRISATQNETVQVHVVDVVGRTLFNDMVQLYEGEIVEIPMLTPNTSFCIVKVGGSDTVKIEKVVIAD